MKATKAVKAPRKAIKKALKVMKRKGEMRRREGARFCASLPPRLRAVARSVGPYYTDHVSVAQVKIAHCNSACFHGSGAVVIDRCSLLLPRDPAAQAPHTEKDTQWRKDKAAT